MFERLARFLGKPDPPPAPTPATKHKRNYYVAARIGGNAGPIGLLHSKDQELKYDMLLVRRNSRLVANNNPFMRRYLRTLGGQVVGAKGLILQSKAPKPYEDRIENAFAKWGKRGVCTACGKYSWAQVQRLAIRTMAADGEVFIRRVWGLGRHGFSLQFIDADLLNHRYSRPASPGHNAIVMGVELDLYSRPVGYWFSDPAQAQNLNTYSTGQRVFIPAADIWHGYDPERVNQTRGMPWTSSALFLLDMLANYWMAEVSAARHEADRIGFLKSNLDDGEGEGMDRSENADVSPEVISASIPGDTHYYGLPAGYEVQMPDVKHPNIAFAEFSRSMLKGIASGLGISYAALASDLTQVSYSSIRQGALEDREYYQELQHDQLMSLAEWVFEGWFDGAQLVGALNLPAGYGYDKIFAHSWTPRGWGWVDPKNDAAARDLALRNRTTSRTRILAEQGIDFEEIVEELTAEEILLKKAGLDPMEASKGAPPEDPALDTQTPPTPPDTETEDPDAES